MLAIFVLALGYGVYWVMQGSDGNGRTPEGRGETTRAAAPGLPSTAPAGMGPGDRAYWERFDPRTGQRSSRLRAQRYQPMKDGRVRVMQPEADFFLHDGRVMRIIGETGIITMEEGASRESPALGGTMNRVPRSGDIYGVTLLLLPSLEAKKPDLTMTMNNASFDNETFLITTGAFTENGKLVPGDQVPVTVRGVQYEFDGTGLRLQYNELDRRLDYLRIAHGRRLLIKDPGEFMGQGGADERESPSTRPAQTLGGADARPAWGEARGLIGPSRVLSGMVLAVADGPAVLAAARPGGRRPGRPVPVTRPVVEQAPVPEPVYRATFSNDVEVLQGGQRLAVARDMIVDFLNEGSNELGMLGTGPAQALATRPATRATAGGPIRPRAAQAASRPARRVAATGPTTAPAPEAIEVRWNGPLTVVPLPGDRPERMAPGQSIVKLVGSTERPVQVTRAAGEVSSQIKAGTLTYWSIDNGVLLESGGGIPVEMLDSRGTHIVTNSLVYSQTDGTALLTGRSHASLPLADDAEAAKKDAKKPELMNVDWTDRCTLYLQGDRLEAMLIERADLRGNVSVDHPQMKMKSDSVQLAFAQQGAEPAGTAGAGRSTPPLRQIDANGAVRCTMLGPKGEGDIREFDCDSLKVQTARTPEGKLYARSIAGIGQVHAIDSERDLRAGYVHVALAAPATQPTTRPATAPVAKGAEIVPGELETLVAHDKVTVVTKDGRSARANQMTLEVKDKHVSVTLQGEPAEVKQEKNTLTGPIIHMVPDSQQISVTGAGSLDAIAQKTADAPARPVRVTWERNMRADGKENLVECFGGVEAKTTDADGSVTTVKGDRVRITTTTRPATQPAGAATKPASRPTTRPGDFDALGDRVIRSIALQDQAVVESVLKDAKGQLLRMFHVDSSSIHYDRDARRLTIPQSGRLLFVDNRAPSTQPAAQEAAKDPMGIRGRTGFQWSKSLVYDEAASCVTMTGDVVIGRLVNPSESTEPLQLSAQKVVADLDATPEAATRPVAADEFVPRMQFKRVQAEGNIRITSKGLDFEAETIEYDPAKHRMIVRGTEQKRAIKRDAMGLEEGSFDELVWDTEKGEVVSVKNLVGKLTKSGGGLEGPGK